MRANHNNWDRTLDGESSLAEFRHIIQIAMGWVDEYLHQFHIYGKDYRISYDGGFLFSDDDSLVLLDDFDFDSGDRFTYTYNFYANCTHDIRIEVMASASQRSHCASGNGLVSPPAIPNLTSLPGLPISMDTTLIYGHTEDPRTA